LITVLAGGVGAAKLILGLANIMPNENLTIIVNTGDDRIDFQGLYISPDIDIIMYTLANMVDTSKGWGVANDTFNCLEMLGIYGLETWFQLGDKDLATHIYRTWLYRQGYNLDKITETLSRKLSIKAKIIPMTNTYTPTFIKTPRGTFHFEEYLIKYHASDKVDDVIYKNIEKAEPAPRVIESLENADGIIICPSNPIVSIGPIIKIKGIKETIKKKNSIAISPIVGDKPIKGPADKLMLGLGYEVSALGVAKIYQSFIKSLIIDDIDIKYLEKIKKLGINVYHFDTIMDSTQKKVNLARYALNKLLDK